MTARAPFAQCPASQREHGLTGDRDSATCDFGRPAFGRVCSRGNDAATGAQALVSALIPPRPSMTAEPDDANLARLIFSTATAGQGGHLGGVRWTDRWM